MQTYKRSKLIKRNFIYLKEMGEEEKERKRRGAKPEEEGRERRGGGGGRGDNFLTNIKHLK